MANYTLNVLRNKTLYPSKGAAIEALNRFEHHSFGQPISLLYQGTDGPKLLFAVGIKNADEETERKTGPDFYEIINDVRNIEVNETWRVCEHGVITPSQIPFVPVQISMEDFTNFLSQYTETFKNHIFFVECEDQDHNKYGVIYKGNVPYSSLGESSYSPDEALLNQPTIALGGIPAGTLGQALAGKTFSEMFDTLLFPTYCPRYFGPSASISLSSASLVKIFGTLPTPTYSNARAYTQTSNSGANKVYGGDVTSETKTPPTSDSSTPGTKTWSYSVTFAQGTDGVKDSKGAVMSENKTAPDYSTLLVNGSANENLIADGNKYVIKQLTKSATNASVEVVYPYFLPNTSGVPTEQGLTSNSYIENYDYNAQTGGQHMYAELPSTITQSSVQIFMQDKLSKEWMPQTQVTPVSAGNKTINGHSVAYTKYQITMPGGLNGDAKYKVSFTKPTA